MTPSEHLDAIHQKWSAVCTCELKNQCTQAVPGIGNPHAQVVFIGEAPGKDEDLQGEPFVGRAGTFLNEMLELVGWTRHDVYITNTIKYRPPNNRDPLPSEKTACYEWLIEELNCIQPLLICTLGRHALNTFIPEAKISEVHGTLLKQEVILSLPTNQKSALPTTHFFALYHPAAALYNGSLRATLIEDFKKIPELLISLTQSDPSSF